MENNDIENLIKTVQRTKELQDAIDSAQDRTQEQIELSGESYQPSDMDMVELPDGSFGGIITAIPDRKGNFRVVLKDGTEVRASANKLLLRGCWTYARRDEDEIKK